MHRSATAVSGRVLQFCLLLAVFLLTAPSFAQSHPKPVPTRNEARPTQKDEAEKDDALGRLRWQIREYGVRTPQSRHRLLQESIQHNRRMGRGSGLNGALTSGERAAGDQPNMPLGSTAGPAWINIGPTGADFEQNGTTTYYQRDSGRLRTILAHPTDGNTVYILASAGGLWVTHNFEAATPSWQPLTDYLPTTAGGAVTFGRSPSTLYLGLGDPYDQITVGGAIVKSTDGGATWSPMIELGNAVSVRDVKVDTSADTDIVLVATDIGLFRSTDAGATYTQVAANTGEAFNGMMIWSLAQTSAGWVAAAQVNCPVYGNAECQTQGQIFVSADKGATWTPATTNITKSGRGTLAVGTPGDSIVYAYTSYWTAGDANSDLKQGDLFRSTDGGLTWTALGVNTTKVPTNSNSDNRNMDLMHAQAWYNQMILVDPNDPARNTVYLGGDLSTAKTSDGGATWKLITNWIIRGGLPYVHADCHAAAFKLAGTPMVLFGSDGGIFASTDGGTTWTSDKNNGLTTHMFYTITGNPQFPNFAMGGLQDNGTRARAGSTGTFNQINGGDGFGVAFSQGNAEASFVSVYNLSIRRSRTKLPPVSYTEIEAVLSNPGDGGFYTPIYTPTAAADPSGKFFFTYGSTNFVSGGVTHYPSIYFTPDGGSGWYYLTTVGGNNSSGTPNGLAAGVVFRNTPFDFGISPLSIDHMAIGANGGRVFVSTDAGDNWTQTTLSAGSPPAVPPTVPGWLGFISNVTWADNSTLYVTSVSQAEGLQNGVRTVRVVKSADMGATWTDASVGLPDVPVTKVLVDPRDATHNTLYAATHVGVYRTTDGGNSWAAYGTGLPNVRVNDMYMPPNGGYLRIATYGRGLWELGELEYVAAALADDGNSCDANGVLGNNETGHLTVTLKNTGAAALNGVSAVVTSDNPHLVVAPGTTMTFPTIAAGAQATGSIPVTITGASGMETANLTIAFADPAMQLPTPATVTTLVRFNYDEAAKASAAESFESANHGWTVTGPTPKLPDVFNWERRELTPAQHAFAITASNAATDNSLISPVMHTGTGAVSFSFKHRHNFQVGSINTTTKIAGWYDGGVLEISTDGTTWTDLGSYLAAPYSGMYVYNGTPIVFTGTITSGTNPLVGRASFGGKNVAYPDYDTVTVNLGTNFADKDIQVRFRAATNSSGGSQGWEVDDVTFTGLANTPFTSLVAHNEACATTLSLNSAPNPSDFGDPITFQAALGGGVTPTTGNVVLQEGTTTLATAPADHGQATFSISNLSIGNHNLTAAFAGDAGHAASAASVYAQTVVAAPRVALSKATMAFDKVMVGATSASTVTLTNSGSAPMTVTSITATGDYSVAHNCAGTLPVNSACTLTVTFKPTVSGTRTGTLTVVNDSRTSPNTVALSGTGSDFALSGTTTQTAPHGNSVVYDLTLASSGGFTGPVNFTCSGAPQYARCEVSPASVTLDANGSASVSVIVTTSQTIAALRHGTTVFAGFFAVGGLLLLPFGKSGRKRLGMFVAVLTLGLMMGGLVACGGSKSTTPTIATVSSGSYTLTVTATSGSTTRTTHLTLIVP